MYPNTSAFPDCMSFNLIDLIRGKDQNRQERINITAQFLYSTGMSTAEIDAFFKKIGVTQGNPLEYHIFTRQSIPCLTLRQKGFCCDYGEYDLCKSVTYPITYYKTRCKSGDRKRILENRKAKKYGE